MEPKKLLRYIGASSSDEAMRRAGDAAYNRVESDYGTLILVVERFDRTTTERDGETYGELWIANDAGTAELEELEAEWHAVDSYGYELEEEA